MATAKFIPSDISDISKFLRVVVDRWALLYYAEDKCASPMSVGALYAYQSMLNACIFKCFVFRIFNTFPLIAFY